MDQDILQRAVDKISGGKYYCAFCGGRLEAAMKVKAQGPHAFLCAIVEHPGMICGSAEWMIDVAGTALENARLSTPP